MKWAGWFLASAFAVFLAVLLLGGKTATEDVERDLDRARTLAGLQ